jgi:hypothetical protein
MANSRRLPTTALAMAWRLLDNPLSGPISRVLTTAGRGAPGLARGALVVRSVWPWS